ncbi:uncharacterized protein DUF397 [Stackebrandtia albiflava]|uniref:Uncharacterized protein DUF397 n=1 Tax=Stackebrandtia albiflava TaxID=406432 RepID=A0A562V2T5_9ACTN|nr:DUF397 domain-containing protein [Stackebrandtia albiflava]TWJ12153.1 uncharacterized protein DUF397 [Stackebrandtia albiflava]
MTRIPNPPWRKSSRSGGNASNGCVEARLHGTHPQLSDSRHAGTRPILDLDPTDYHALLTTVCTGLA